MKLATLRNGAPGGRLVVVSHDLTRCSDARHIAPTLKAALDDWATVAPELELIARSLESGGQPVERFHERAAHAPLPALGQDPRAELRPKKTGVTVAAGALALFGGDPAAVRVIMLVADFDGADRACSPVAATPDELGALWQGGVLAATPDVSLNDTPVPAEGALDFPPLTASRDGPAVAHWTLPAPPTLRPGDRIRIAMRDPTGRSIFGAIEREARPAARDWALAAIDHLQLAIPAGAEAACRPFFTATLGMTEIPKPPELATCGGLWFRSGGIELHLGVDPDFRPARKAHPAFSVAALDRLAEALAAAGHPVRWDTPLAGHRRFFTDDPVGNRLEFIEAEA